MIGGALPLSKLTIKAYPSRESQTATRQIEAMYNPASIQLSYRAELTPQEYLNSLQVSNQYQRIYPGALRLDLVFDATLPENRDKSIDAQLDELRAMCSSVDAKSGETRFLRVYWGKMSWNGRGYFAGRLADLDVRYTMFDRAGRPLRATTSLNIIADESAEIQKAQTGLSAPEHRIVTAGALDTLPLIAAQVGNLKPGISADYLDIAYANDLNNLRSIVPGTRLLVSAEQRSE
ncbi:MAG: hypothetical protein H0X39_12205 [Actinobacteria bacterium]|nr:hypothetical protein [Actinomycetota bacterium]